MMLRRPLPILFPLVVTSTKLYWVTLAERQRLLERAFSGSAKALLIGALSAKKTTKAELTELRKLVDEYAKEAK